MARTSASRGTLVRVRGSGVSSDAAISFRAAFLAPLMGISPFSGRSPRIRMRSMTYPMNGKGVVAGGPAQGKPGKDRTNLSFSGAFWGAFRRFRRGFGARFGGGFGGLGRVGFFAPLEVGPKGRGQLFG